jgi:hypothetical protein
LAEIEALTQGHPDLIHQDLLNRSLPVSTTARVTFMGMPGAEPTVMFRTFRAMGMMWMVGMSGSSLRNMAIRKMSAE